MHILLRSQGMEVPTAAQDHLRRRVQFALGRFEQQIARVEVYVADVNGPRGGVDKRCVACVKLMSGGAVTVMAREGALSRLIDRVAKSAGFAVSKELARRRARVIGPARRGHRRRGLGEMSLPN